MIELKNKTHQYYCLEESHFKCKDTCRLEVKGWKKIFHANRNQNKAGVAILILNKIDFKIKTLIMHKEVCCIIIKESVQQGDITFVNIYVLNIGAPIRKADINRPKGGNRQQYMIRRGL